jgi:hypothetical protein
VAPVIATGNSTATSVSVHVTVPRFTTGYTIFASIPVYFRFGVSGSAQITATPGKAGATMGVGGEILVNSAVHRPNSMYRPGNLTIVRFPLSAGLNDQLTTYFYALGQLHYMTVDFFGWTPGTRSFKGLTYRGFPISDVTAMGTFALTGLGGGHVSLVTPTKVTITGPLVARKTASFTRLNLTFAPTVLPEPGALFLLAAGAVALLSRRRRGSS